MNISISYDNLVARIESQLSEDMIKFMCQALRYRPDGYQHVFSYKSKRWDGYSYLYDIATQSFRRGLLARVVSTLQYMGHTVTTKYTGQAAELVDHNLKQGLFRPYDFQLKVDDAVQQSPIGIIVSPTGTGKTVMISRVLNALKRVSLVLVTDVVLLDQMQQALQNYFDQPIGIIGDGEFDLQNITVSTIQSLQTIKKAKSISAADKRKVLMKHLDRVGAVISDEAHLYDSAQVADIMSLFTSADRFYGMSATPYGWDGVQEKRENMELEQHFGSVIYDTRRNNFIELGLKVPVYVQVIKRRAVNEKYNRLMKKSRFKKDVMEPDFTANYRECLEKEILKNEQYHDEVADYVKKMVATGNSAFVHCIHSLEFGESIHKRIPDSVLVTGQTKRKDRRAIYDAMRKKEILAMVSDVGGTGLDIPSLNAMILASDVQDIRQLKGRVERADKAPGATKDVGLLVDFYTKTQFLTKHFEARRSQYEHDGHLIL